MPDLADFVRPGEVKALGTRKSEVGIIEEFFRTMRLKYDPILLDFLSANQCRKVLRELEWCTLRLALSKPAGSVRVRAPNGVITWEKLKDVEMAWQLYVQEVVKPPRLSKWVFVGEAVTADEEEAVLVPTFGENLQVAEDDGEPTSPSKKAKTANGSPFAVGALVQLDGWRVTGKDTNGTRVDIQVGAVGKVLKVDADDHRCAVAFDCSSSSSGATRRVQANANWENLTVFKKQEEEQGKADGEGWL